MFSDLAWHFHGKRRLATKLLLLELKNSASHLILYRLEMSLFLGQDNRKKKMKSIYLGMIRNKKQTNWILDSFYLSNNSSRFASFSKKFSKMAILFERKRNIVLSVSRFSCQENSDWEYGLCLRSPLSKLAQKISSILGFHFYFSFVVSKLPFFLGV